MFWSGSARPWLPTGTRGRQRGQGRRGRGCTHSFSSTIPLAWEQPAKGFFHSDPRLALLKSLSAHRCSRRRLRSLRPAPSPRVLLRATRDEGGTLALEHGALTSTSRDRKSAPPRRDPARRRCVARTPGAREKADSQVRELRFAVDPGRATAPSGTSGQRRRRGQHRTLHCGQRRPPLRPRRPPRPPHATPSPSPNTRSSTPRRPHPTLPPAADPCRATRLDPTTWRALARTTHPMVAVFCGVRRVWERVAFWRRVDKHTRANVLTAQQRDGAKRM